MDKRGLFPNSVIFARRYPLIFFLNSVNSSIDCIASGKMSREHFYDLIGYQEYEAEDSSLAKRRS